MDYISFFSNLSLVIGFGAGFLYGLKKCFGTRKNLYFQMITAAIGCAAVTRLYNVVAVLCSGEYERGFNVGLVGPISCFCLFLCAEIGGLDNLVDKTVKKNKRASLLAFSAPACLSILFGIMMSAEDLDLIYRVFILFTWVVMGSASYYNFKHLILSEYDNGMFTPLRLYNIHALLVQILSVTEILFMTFHMETAFIINNIILLAVSVVILPVLNRGVEQWTI